MTDNERLEQIGERMAQCYQNLRVSCGADDLADVVWLVGLVRELKREQEADKRRRLGRRAD